MVANLQTQAPEKNIATDRSPHLLIQMGCDRHQQSVVLRQYSTYPYRLSRSLAIDPTDPKRTYLYSMTSSPGLLAGDALRVEVKLQPQSQLYLTDQAATKVHRMPLPGTPVGTKATLTYHLTVDDQASLEFVPEPIILFDEAELEQSMQVTLHPTAQFFTSEIVVPGRLARNEYYGFRRFFSRVQVRSPEGDVLFADAMQLLGDQNPFKHGTFMASHPIIATVMLVVPGIDLADLTARLNAIPADHPSAHSPEPPSEQPSESIRVGYSPLPNCNGLLVRAIAPKVWTLKSYVQNVLACVRQATGQPPLPTIPK